MKRQLADNTFRMKSLAAAVGLLSGGAHALDYEVTNLNDSGDGSLRWAIDQAQSTEGPDAITFASSLSGAINLQSPLPMITEGLSITGPGITLNAAGISNPYGGEPPVINIYSANPYAPFSLSGLTIRGSDSGAVRAGFYYTEGSVSLSDMVITGNTERTAIQVRRANLTIADSVISGNSASQDTGAMAFEYGTLSVTDTEISNNTLETSEGMAGAVSLRYADATIERTSITGNTSGASAGGIGMRRASLVLRDSSVDNNVAAGNGGGIMAGGFSADLEVENSSISGNQAGVSSGGGYYFEGPRGGSGGAIAMFYSFPPATRLSLSSSIISGNSASRIGGAIRFSGNFAAYGSKISDNSASYAGAFDMRVTGGVIFGSTISGNTAQDAAVGAIQVERSYGIYGPRIGEPVALAGPVGYGVFSIDSSTISGNSLTGDDEGAVTLFAYIDRNAELVIENSTISNNPAAGPVVEVYSDSRYASFTMRNSTMSGNSSSSSQSVMLVENIGDVQLANNTFVDNNATLPSLVSGETAQVSLHNSLYQRYDGPYGSYIYGQMNVSVSGNAMTSSNDKEMLVGGLPAGASPYSEGGDPVAADLSSNIMANGVTIAANSTNDGEAPDMVDPQLGALSMQGGFTAVHMPLAGSPAIDGGDTNMRPAGRDQRGLQTVINNFDIGSVEVTSNTAPTLTIDLPKQIGGAVGKVIPSFVLADLYEDAEGDAVIIEGVYGLPAGVTWDGTNIAGTLEQVGTYLVTVIARDDREDSLEAITQVEVVVTEKAAVRKDDDDDDFLGSVPLGGLALLGFLAALRRRRH